VLASTPKPAKLRTARELVVTLARGR